MGFSIRNGVGNSDLAKVDNNNRLHTLANVIGSELAASKVGLSFIAHGRCHLAAAASGAFCAIQNTSTTHDLYITRIYLDGHTLTDDIVITQSKNPTVSSGSVVTIVNKDFGEAKLAEATFTISNSSADLTLTGGTDYHAFVIRTLSSEMRDMRASNLLKQDDIIGWKWETIDAGSAVNAEIISFSINMFFSPKNGA